ncbi:MAG TPA: NAD(P)-dependent alcohol dehydrogenase, partial [Thermoanaerobaculia bacterium]|nr:NAD(P)-dependent alcohol dehydrogenase [Thermoanaerobaculia bacterium]
MKALIYRDYGGPDVLHLEEVEKPTPGAEEALVRVRAASINPLDWHFMRGKPYPIRLMTGMRRPKTTRIGVDVAGVVEAVGSGVSDLKVGDEVFGSCRGALAEFVCTSKVVRKPKRLTFEQAAAVNIAGLTALQSLRDGARVRAGEKVLINGAAGGVGTFAVQIAKLFGAEVTGVCSSKNLDTVRSLGADHAIDYGAEDFTRGRDRYDVILDAIGNHPLADLRSALAPAGRYVAI